MQGKIHHQIGLEIVYEGNQIAYIVGIDLRRFDFCFCRVFKLGFKRIALAFGTACNAYFVKHRAVLATLVNRDRRHRAASYYQCFSHFFSFCCF